MIKDDIINALFLMIGEFMSDHPKVRWRDMYDAVYEVNDHYKNLESWPSVESKSEASSGNSD
jgi:hypothetical protein